MKKPSVVINKSLNSYWMKKAFNTFYGVPFHADLHAPSTSRELAIWSRVCKLGVDSLPVYPNGCEKTIFASPDDNLLFRAWHDCIHLELNKSFSLADETSVFALHVEQLQAIKAPQSVIAAIHADGIAQVKYYYQHKIYVSDQHTFVYDVLNQGMDEVLSAGRIY